MRKRFILLCVCGFLGITAFATEITEQEALKKAQHFMAGKKFIRKAANRRASSNKQRAFYVFNVQEKGGFVIVSGDDRTPDILGYADKGALDVENAPCNVKWLLSCYEKTIDSLRLVQDDVSASHNRAARRSAERAEIAPMITTHWGQGAPYNNMCPEVNGDKCLTGCVATAMAQIMNYHKWPQGNTAAIDAYTTSSQGINVTALEASTFDWNNMKDEYYNVSTTDAEKEAVAKLMRYCGQAVNMDYGLEASGADGWVANPLKSSFNYSNSTDEFLGTKLSAEHLEELVYNELAENRPVFYTGSNQTLGGHAFVVDGYNTDGTFHINWGWNGDDDGYFVLTGLTEDVMPFPFQAYNTNVVYSIEPPAPTISSSKVAIGYITYSTRSIYRNNHTEDFSHGVRFNIEFESDYDGNFDIGLGLFNEENQLIKVLYHEVTSFPLNETILKTVSFGNDIPIGTYKLNGIYRYNESDEWKKSMRSSYHQLIVYVNERSLQFADYLDDANGEYEEYDVVDVDGITYKLYSEFGNKRASVLPYQVSGQYAGNIVIPNEIVYNNEIYNVYKEEDDYNLFCDNNEITQLTCGTESGLNRISNCPNLTQLSFTHGRDIEIQGCHAIEHLDLPPTMNYPNIRYCNGLKTLRIRCLSVSWNSAGITTVNWDNESLPALTDVYFYTPTPPPVGPYSVFRNGNWEHEESNIPANTNATLHVPKGSLNTYKSSRWQLWNIVDDVEAEPYVTWGYCHSNAVSKSGMAIKLGDNNSECAMRIPSNELSSYRNCKITHIQVYSASRVTNDFGGYDYEYVFLTKPGTDYIIKQPFKVVRGMWNTIELEQPYTITGEELFVGMGKKGRIEATFSDDTYVLDASWVRGMGTDNSGMVPAGTWHLPCPKDLAHPLPIRFVIEGTDMPEGLVIRELGLNGIDDVASARNNDAEFQTSRRSSSGISLTGVIRNRSLDLVESYTIKYTIDAGEPQTKSVETIMAPNATENVSIELPASLNDGRNHTISTDVTLVNGANNGLMGANMPAIDIVKLLGDVNGDNSVSVSDVINTISHVLKDTPNLFIRGAAQMNDDDEISVTDVIGLINLALGSNPSRQLDEINMEVE